MTTNQDNKDREHHPIQMNNVRNFLSGICSDKRLPDYIQALHKAIYGNNKGNAEGD